MNREHFRHYDHDLLVDTILDQNLTIKELLAKVEEFREEAERYHRESRDSAKTLGGIIRVLRENGIDLEPAPGRPVRMEPSGHGLRSRRPTTGPECFCGAQWLEQANRCVTQGPTVLVNPMIVTRDE